MITFSSFNNANLFPSMFFDCCMHKSREWGLRAALAEEDAAAAAMIIDLKRAKAREMDVPAPCGSWCYRS